MRRTLILAVLGVAASFATPAAADRADDELAVVKKAVASESVAEAKQQPSQPVRSEAKPRAERRARAEAEPEKTEPQRPRARLEREGRRSWFRVRIVDKNDKNARVSLDLPLPRVKDVDECEIGHDHHGHHHHGCLAHALGNVLRALDPGDTLVDIEDEDATIRVWVD